MRSHRGLIIMAMILLPALLLPTLAVLQSVPHLINYQGRLTNALGLPLADGTTVDLTFSFYGAAEGGTTYLAALQEDVVVNGGLYNVLIGSGTITPGSESSLAAVFQRHAEVWMGVRVDGDEEMTPRSRVTSTAYALKAERAESCENIDPAWLRLDDDADGYNKIEDCNDEDASINPGAVDLCGDGIDQNCANGDCRWVGAYDTPGTAMAVYVVGSYAYVADGDSGLRIIDVSNPAAPAETGFYDTPGTASNLVVAGSYAYVADLAGGLQIINISNPASPTLAGSLALDSADGIAVSGNYAYVGDGNRLRIVNISNPVAPSQTSFLVLSDSIRDVKVSGGYAWLAVEDAGGLQIVNVSSPSSPAWVATYDTPGSALGLALAGGQVYVADADAGLEAYALFPPVPAGAYNTPGSARDVFVSGNHAYVADQAAGLQILDVSDPGAITAAGTYDTPGNANGVFVSGDYVYVADGDSGLQIIYAKSPP